ncbi:hypothetical protein D3C72_1153470 [compost metagenome]
MLGIVHLPKIDKTVQLNLIKLKRHQCIGLNGSAQLLPIQLRPYLELPNQSQSNVPLSQVEILRQRMQRQE